MGGSSATLSTDFSAPDAGREGKPLRDAAFLLLFNAHHESLDFRLPPASFGESWGIVLDTTTDVREREGRFAAGSALAVEGRSVIVLSPL